ncbi:hypothetical protein QT972_34500, partial [Microcoleus sp. herbarium7]|uniref:hypothetical protein n=1 Tax=Microcoleus sp. herbarium7 TaxID=3055435 RepID=UPI002FCFDDAD
RTRMATFFERRTLPLIKGYVTRIWYGFGAGFKPQGASPQVTDADGDFFRATHPTTNQGDMLPGFGMASERGSSRSDS